MSTNDQLTPEHQGQIAVFYQRHRTGLVTLVFTDLVDSTALMRQLGDQAGTTFLQQRRQIGSNPTKVHKLSQDLWLLHWAPGALEGMQGDPFCQKELRAFRQSSWHQ
jgi:class 3 adenylate cyclase